jgi:hypothetical protein
MLICEDPLNQCLNEATALLKDIENAVTAARDADGDLAPL